MRKPVALLAALGLTATLTTVALPAQADALCTITNYSPRTVVVGLSPVATTFKVSTTGCSREGWDLDGEDFYVYDANPQEVFSPYSNSETKPKDVVVEAYNRDYETRAKVFADSFRLKRRTTWDKFNASPEPVRKGAAITVQGRLRIADWSNDRYIGYTSRTVAVEFRTKTGKYSVVKYAKTGSGGYLKTTVKASKDGYWRLRYGGNTIASSALVAGDFVDVK